MRTIVIAKTVAEGRKRFPNAVAIVTPRTGGVPARGVLAERIVVTLAMRREYPAAVLPLMEEVAPCLVASGGAAALPAGVSLEGAEDGRSDDEEREQATQEGAERAGGDPEHESSGDSVHESDVTE